MPARDEPACRFCGAGLGTVVADLGMQPLANAYVRPEDLRRMEPFYPLRVYVCGECLLVQLEELVSPRALFGDYAYFSSYSETWLEHARAYAAMAVERFAVTGRSRVIEVGSNDGYLLQYLAEREIPVLGIEPAANVAEAALAKGIPTVVAFFGEAMARRLAAEGTQADLLVGNNVLAQVPDLNDFVQGLRVLLAPRGVLTMEFPHVMRLIGENQFDTIYHEHFSYFSLVAVERIFARHGLTLFDVEEIPTHGGSLRIYARHAADDTRPVGPGVARLRAAEQAAGLTRVDGYLSFGERVKEAKRGLLAFLIAAKRAGKTVAGYGAPAKGTTLLNYCGIGRDFVDYTVDRSPYKQGRFLPGCRIPVYHPDAVRETRPDYLLMLPWNLKEEIMRQMACVREWGGRFVAPIPWVTVFS